MSLIAFPYYGGKNCMVDKILPLIPPHVHYVEPFGGSAAVLLNKEQSKIETYNDLDGLVVNFFRVLRENPDELIRQLQLTPYSREEYDNALLNNLTDIEKARGLYIHFRQGMKAKKTNNTWLCNMSYDKRSGLKLRAWKSAIEKIMPIAERFSNVQIENLPGLEIIQKYDGKNTFFYIDPPYVFGSRSHKGDCYSHEMTDYEHETLLAQLAKCKGKVLLSGYPSELYEKHLASWHKIEIEKTINSSKGKRVEVLWMNYEPPNQQLQLFG